MGHVYVDVELIGPNGKEILRKVLIDTGATFTVIPPDVIKQLGASKIPVPPIELTLGDGRRVKAELYAVGISMIGRTGGTVVAVFDGATPMIGVLTLEALGLKVNPVTGSIEEERPPNTAYLLTGSVPSWSH